MWSDMKRCWARAIIPMPCLLAALITGLLGTSRGHADDKPAGQAMVLEIVAPLGPATADYVVRELKALEPSVTRLVILRMDTPGGLDTAMRAIIQVILASSVPVATYVAPSGARAASAGTYISCYAATIAAMAPGTNLGAATPIRMGEDTSRAGDKAEAPQDVETRKIVNDAVAYIRSLAELRGRHRQVAGGGLAVVGWDR